MITISSPEGERASAASAIFPGFSDRPGTSYNGLALIAFGVIGYELDLSRIMVEPFLGASGTTYT